MSARQNIAALLAQWLQLTREESAAIQSAAWPALKKIQARKAALQPPLAEAVTGPIPADLRAQAGRIISLLTRNGLALAAQLRQARARQAAFDEVKRNLQRIRRSYTRAQPGGRWQSYS